MLRARWCPVLKNPVECWAVQLVSGRQRSQSLLLHRSLLVVCVAVSLKGSHYSICFGVALELYCSFLTRVSRWEKTKQTWGQCSGEGCVAALRAMSQWSWAWAAACLYDNEGLCCSALTSKSTSNSRHVVNCFCLGCGGNSWNIVLSFGPHLCGNLQ